MVEDSSRPIERRKRLGGLIVAERRTRLLKPAVAS